MQPRTQPQWKQNDGFRLAKIVGIQNVQLTQHSTIIIHEGHHISVTFLRRTGSWDKHRLLDQVRRSREVHICLARFTIKVC